MDKVIVRFEYDEPTRKWEAVVTGVRNATEAKQAFHAVVLTCNQFYISMTERTGYFVQTMAQQCNGEPGFDIIPAIKI